MNIFSRYLPLQRQIFFSISLLLVLCLGIFSMIASYHISKSYTTQKDENLQREVNIITRELNYTFRHSDTLSTDSILSDDIQRDLNLKASSFSLGLDIYSLQGEHLFKSSSDYTSVYHDIESSASNHGLPLPQNIREKVNSSNGSLLISEHLADSMMVSSIYSKIQDLRGRNIGILCITYPDTYFTTDIITQLSRRMTITMGILLVVALALSMFIARGVTRPLKKLKTAIADTSACDNTDQRIDSSHLPMELRPLADTYNTMLSRIQSQTRDIAADQKERAWQQMAKIVAHEINNPLTPMRLSVQHFQMTFRPDAPDAKQKSEELCRVLLQQIDTLSQIASSFASFSSGDEKSHTGRCDLSRVVKDVAGLYTTKSISTHIQHDDIIIALDATAVVQILSNMIKNALEAAQPSLPIHIDIKLSSAEGHAVLIVSDNGNGIPQDIIKDIFSPSFTTKSSGMGMGLPIIQKIVQGAGGSISCHSTVGQGTEFTIKIPLLS